MTLLTNTTEEAGEHDYKMSFADFKMREDALKDVIEKSDAAIRLHDNKDFQNVIIDMYIKNEPVRLAAMRASGKLDERNERIVMEDIIGVGKFQNFMSNITRAGIQAKEDLNELHAYRDVHGLRE